AAAEARARSALLDPGRLGYPVAGDVEPEGKSGVALVPPEAPLDRLVARLAAAELRVLGPGPGVEDQTRIAAEQHQHLGRRVRSDTGKREQPRLDLGIGQLWVEQRLQVELLLGHVARDRSQVGAAVAGADDVRLEALVLPGHHLRVREGMTPAG